MIFITRNNRVQGDWDSPSSFADLHVAERGLVPNLPEWRKMPYCRNGGMNLQKWFFIELDPVTVHHSRVCGSCRKRMAANNLEPEWLAVLPKD